MILVMLPGQKLKTLLNRKRVTQIPKFPKKRSKKCKIKSLDEYRGQLTIS